MELVKDIYFNTDKLIENTRVKVSYTGKFYQGNNEQVFIHYGYGKDWNNVNEVEMQKTDLGYQTELDLIGEDTLNFCFKNQNNEWDNNCGKNYIFNIEKTTVNSFGKTSIGVTSTTPTGSFFGKTFGKDTDNTTADIFAVLNTKNTTPEQAGFVDGTTPLSGVIEDSVIGTPNSIDTVINKATGISTIENAGNIEIGGFGNIDTIPGTGLNIGNSTLENVTTNFTNTANSNITNLDNGITQKISYNIGVSTPTLESKLNTAKVNIINPVANAIKKTANQAVTIAKKTANQVTNAVKNNANQNTNAIAIKPTGFNLWTQKIKTTVSKFFSYVPKLISGNYKRNVSENKK